jgi:hypothetical protein
MFLLYLLDVAIGPMLTFVGVLLFLIIGMSALLMFVSIKMLRKIKVNRENRNAN